MQLDGALEPAYLRALSHNHYICQLAQITKIPYCTTRVLTSAQVNDSTNLPVSAVLHALHATFSIYYT